jgi:DNA-binding CsgD family transcriptional regulator
MLAADPLAAENANERQQKVNTSIDVGLAQQRLSSARLTSISLFWDHWRHRISVAEGRMYAIGRRDFDAAMRILQGAFAAHDSEALGSYLLERLPKLTPCLYVGVGGVSIGQTAQARSAPAEFTTPRNCEIAAQYIHELPEAVEYQRAPRSVFIRCSDCSTFATFDRSTMYQELYRRQGVRDACVLLIPTNDGWLDFYAIVRDSRIPDRDRNVLVAISPHLVQCHRTARAVTRLQRELGDLRTANDQLNRAVIAVGPNGKILRLSEWGRLLIGRYFGKITQSLLPGKLLDWTLGEIAALRQPSDLPRPRVARVIERPGRRLIIRILLETDYNLIVAEEQITDIDIDSLKALGLTQRQSEVLSYVALGKSNPEIGTILGVSPRTVGKHVEEILLRLNVSTRTEAAVAALDATVLRDAGNINISYGAIYITFCFNANERSQQRIAAGSLT